MRTKTLIEHPLFYRGLFLFIFALGVIRFMGLEISPPGFYVDEAAGAAQVMCLKQTGLDFEGHAHPLFVHGLGGGYYTAPYIYGQMIWTSVLGDSVAAYRSYLSFITALSILFLYLWLRERAPRSTARYAALFASISPWVFQFARIAWDPPLAPLFILMGLFAFELKRKHFWILGALCFALASYAYPPTRIQAVLLLAFLPKQTARQKIASFALFGVALLPMAIYSLSDPSFTARGQMLALWSDYSMNPYAGQGILARTGGFVSQFFAHFGPSYLFAIGDHNLRHSTGAFGILSYVEGAVLIAGALLFITLFARFKVWLRDPRAKNYAWILLGLASGIAPAALTWEGVPHALRSIGAWPFFAALAAMVATEFGYRFKYTERLVVAASIAFSLFFLNYYFRTYPAVAESWFTADSTPLGSAYGKMTRDNRSCAELQMEAQFGAHP